MTSQPNNHTEIICIVDESGSMQHLQQHTIEGFNKFVDEQRAAPGTANLTLITFNNGWRTPIKSTSVNLVPALDTTSYRPDGGTALLDAIGNAIKHHGELLENGAAPGADVVFVIITDGGENASTDYKLDQVKEMIVAREARGWKFIYLGANQDAFSVAGSMGVQGATTSNYVASATGTASSWGYSSGTVGAMRVAKQHGVKMLDSDFEKLKQDWKDKLEDKDDSSKTTP